jgi:uncharacterized membrane protein
VAVAVALLPPLASAGVLAMSGEFELAIRSKVGVSADCGTVKGKYGK